MHTSHEHEDDLFHDDCGCGQCEAHDGPQYVDEDLYDDPYDVVMYDIDAGEDDLYALIEMLGDSARYWYASRRLNALAASGPLSALVADIIVDSLGRRWDPLLHPRDRFGRFINTGGFLRWLASGTSDWLRGQVSRIDSDGNIHVRAVGNDSIPDGTIYKFKPELSNKLVSTQEPVASLEDIDLDADIPDFPEASDVQKRIWNNLGNGDIPAEDLDRALADLDLSVEDFAGEVKGLEDRGLIEIDRSGDKPRVRRNDADVKAVVDVGDDEIADVPDDETPDLEDSPVLTKSQRDLLDAIVEADSGEGDGVTIGEIGDPDVDDIQALLDAGAIEDRGGSLYLTNPEGGDEANAAPAEGRDISDEIFEAAKVLNDEAAQEAFQHYAEELARPGDANNVPLPEDVAPAKRRNAEAAANKWWNERIGDEDGVDNAVLDQREADDFAEQEPEADVPEANPKDALNPRNQALADQLVAEWFNDDEFLDSNIGVEYRGAIKRMFDAFDYDDAGHAEARDIEMDKAARAMRRIDVPEEDIAGWPDEVRNFRLADGEGGSAPGDVPDDMPEVAEDLPAEPESAEAPGDGAAAVLFGDRPSAALYLRDDPDANRLIEEGASEYEWGSEAAMKDLAANLPPLTDEEHDSLWGLNSGYAEGYKDAIADNDAREVDVAPDEVAPEAPDPGEVDQLPEEGFTVEPDAIPEPEDEAGVWEQFAARLDEEGPDDDFFGRLAQENRIAGELGLDLMGEDAPWNWENMAEEVGFGPAELLFKDVGGSIGRAGPVWNRDSEKYIRQHENDLLQKFVNRDPGVFGPEVMRLRQAGLIDATEGGEDWELNEAGRERLGLANELPVDEELQVEEVDLPNESELANEEQNAADVDAILSEEERIANRPDGFDEAHDRVFDAMIALQDGEMDRNDAYDVAARAVGDGILRQEDLDEIQDSARAAIEQGGGQWDNDLAIDHVGNDQFGQNARIREQAQKIVDDAVANEAPNAPAPEGVDWAGAPLGSLVKVADSPDHARAVNQPNPADLPNLTVNAAEPRDRNGRVARVGQWYRAGAGGEGDPGELVAFYDQEKYPNWVVLKMPDGKLKGANLQGKGRDAGLNRINPPSENELQARRVQRAVKDVGFGDVELDQFNQMNVLRDGVPAQVGMRVVSDSGGRLFPRGEEGVIVRFGWSDKWNRPIVYVIRPGAGGQRDEIQMAPKSLRLKAETPTPPTPPTPTPDVPNIDLNNLPNREWQVPSDAELVERLGQVGEVDMVPFVNAFVQPGVVYDQIQEAIQRGEIEVLPGPRIRVPGGGGEGAPDVNLPNGAENAVEAAVLNAVDAAGPEGLPRSQIVNVDNDDVVEQMQAIMALVDRGVLERVEGGEVARFRRVPEVTPPTPLPNGAQNEIEADLLNVIDDRGTAGVNPDVLVDIDADDAPERMAALRSLVDRRVLQRDIPEGGGRPVYRRAVGGARVGAMTHDPARGTDAGSQPMTHEQAVEALKAGADPMTVNAPSLYEAMQESRRFEFQSLGMDGGIGDSVWVIDKQVKGPHVVNASGSREGRVYFVKRPNESNTRANWRAELYAGAISQAVGASDGDPGPNSGLLYHPQTRSASNRRIIADHAGYAFPEGAQVMTLLDMRGDALRELAADRVRLALYDYLINNSTDRHYKNQMYVKLPDGSHRIVIIDNGLGDGAAGSRGSLPDPSDIDFRKFVTARSRNRTRELLKSIGEHHNGLTRDELRDIVQSFYTQYGSLNAQQILQDMQNGGHNLDQADIVELEKWLGASEARVQNLSSNLEEVVDALATGIGIQ